MPARDQIITMPTQDSDIRDALHNGELQHFWDQEDTVVVDELGICRGSRFVDIAVVNCELHGYEIKSSKDTLRRLPGQTESYNAVFDRATLVTAPSHLDEAQDVVPNWWGLKTATEKGGTVHFGEVRESQYNPNPDPVQIAQLMWKDEIRDALEELGIDRGYRSKPKKIMAERLVAGTTRGELSTLVRDALKYREDWRSDEQPSQDDETSPLLPMW